MNRDERAALRSGMAEIQTWVAAAVRVEEVRKEERAARDASVSAWTHRALTIHRDARPAWVVIPFQAGDADLLRPLAVPRARAPLSGQDRQTIDWLTGPVSTAVADAGALFGAKRLFSRRAAKDSAEQAGTFLQQALAWGRRDPDPARHLTSLAEPPSDYDARAVTIERILDPAVGLLDDLAVDGAPEVISTSPLRDLDQALEVIGKAVTQEEPRRRAVLAAADEVRKADAEVLLREMPIKALKEATAERLRFGPIENAGFTSVLDVLRRGEQLAAIAGVGEKTVTRIRAAAQTLWRVTLDDMPIRLDVAKRSAAATTLLRRLADWDASRTTRGAADDLKRAEELRTLKGVFGTYPKAVVVSQPGRSAQMLLDTVAAVTARADKVTGAKRGRGGASVDPWDDFIARAADYFAMLAELGLAVEDDQATQGDLPAEIVEAIREQELRTDFLEASLRGYQAFAARFVLVQKKVVIGDEMGLGKTVEALAVLAHLRAKGDQHFLVVCPASVVTNWTREVSQKSRIVPRRLHGPDRDHALKAWTANGGVAVTTFESLGWLASHKLPHLACLIVDEAHYIKNPDAQRSRRCQALLTQADRSVLLTGTPLENRVEEFKTLVRYLRPDLTVDASELTPRRFRKQVAPAYLRRNTEDVLSELPELVEISEWLPFSDSDRADYRDAVVEGNFMAMRKTAMLGAKSAKFDRLLELVQEAEDNGRRVIVFSFFLDVLKRVAAELPGPVFGPLTGSVPAKRRQEIVDRFSTAQGGAVLVAQIVAGGVGLNIQAASMVIICEPQLKPTVEAQAIARAHRMGQVQTVQVHRLLTEDSVDERIVEILARKQALFEEFARESDTADSSPEAFDITEAQLAREVVDAERLRILRSADAARRGVAEDSAS